MSELTIRYWFTKEDERNQLFYCDWAQVGCSNIQGTFGVTDSVYADSYLEISFAHGAGKLESGGRSGDIQTRFNKADWSNYDELNDYSYLAGGTVYSRWENVALYRNGALVWGQEPGLQSKHQDRVVVEYRATDTDPKNNHIKPHFNLKNIGNTAIPLHELSLRYWYSPDGNTPEQFHCDWATLGCSNITSKFSNTVTGSVYEASQGTYIEIGFTSSAGILARGGQTGEIQARINKSDWSNYNELDDHSFDPSKTTYQMWDKVTVHRNGHLISGSMPGVSSNEAVFLGIGADKYTILPNGSDHANIELYVKDRNGHPVSHTTVMLESDSTAEFPEQVMTDDQGSARFQVTSDIPQLIQIHASTSNGIVNEVTVVAVNPGAPNIVILSPTSANQAITNQSSVSVTGIVASNIDIEAVSYTTSDGRVGHAAGTTHWEISGLGLHQPETTIQVKVTDQMKQESVDSITLIQDQESPQIFLSDTYSTKVFTTLSNSISLTGSAYDNVKLNKVVYEVAGESGTQQGTALGKEKWFITGIPLQNGENKITITAHDAAGNTVSEQVSVIYNPHISFKDSLKINESYLFVNEPKSIRFRLPVQKSNPASGEIITLVGHRAGGEQQQLAVLRDDGNVSLGDDIAQDGIYSGIVNFHETVSGELRVKASVETDVGTINSEELAIHVLERTSPSEINQFTQLNDQLLLYFLKYQESDPLHAEQLTIQWLKGQPGIQDAGLSPNGGSIWYKDHKNIVGGILTGTAAGTKGSDGVQTIQSVSELAGSVELNTQQISSSNVLIASPFASTSLSPESYDALEQQFKSNENYNVNRLKDEAVTVDLFKTLSNYGVIVLDTHGEKLGSLDSAKLVFLTGEKATAANYSKYEADLQQGRLNVVKGYYAITPEFISYYNQTLPNSLIFNGSCLSLYEDTFAQAFLKLGAKSYFGYSGYIKATDDHVLVTELFDLLLNQQKSSGQAYNSIMQSSVSGKELLKLHGASNLIIKSQLISTSFEEGSVVGWLTQGDVRVIPKLGPLEPPHGNYMAIISTGLGSINSSNSSIEQYITIPEGAQSIEFVYNVVSEEPMEFVGSRYDDKFEATFTKDSGAKVVLAQESVNTSAWSKVVGIDFSGGDSTTYMTGWKNVSYNVSGLSGSGKINFKFHVWDMGDSAYDTAALIDNIRISFVHSTDQTDQDQDGIPDQLELQGIPIGYNGEFHSVVFTDPTRKDTDGDGQHDGLELLYLKKYNYTGGFYEAIDHPNSPITSIFAANIYADLEQIVDLEYDDFQTYQSNLISAENYKNKLLVYYQKVTNFASDIAPEDQSVFLVYMEEIRYFIDTLNGVIGEIASSILQSQDEEAVEWLLSSNIGLLQGEESPVTNPLESYKGIDYEDNGIYKDHPFIEGTEEYYTRPWPLLNASQLGELYTKRLGEKPISPYEGFEFCCMNEIAYGKFELLTEEWWKLDWAGGSQDERARKVMNAVALEALDLRNNPCSYVPDEEAPGYGQCGDGWTTFEDIYDNYFFFTYYSDDGQSIEYSVENDLGVFSSNSFAPGTQVQTDRGFIAIENIQVGDLVFSKDDLTGEESHQRVTRVNTHTSDELYRISVAGEVISVTGNHPFWVAGKGWTAVSNIKQGDLLVTHDDKLFPVQQIELTEGGTSVYNLSVEDYHTFFVTGHGFWTHNADLYNRVHTVYVLQDGAGNVKYVGRTVNPKAREAAHGTLGSKTHGLLFKPIHTGLNYQQARGIEMSEFSKHGGFDKLLNSIRPVSQRNKKISNYLKAARAYYKAQKENP
jgi:hypothetical protein